MKKLYVAILLMAIICITACTATTTMTSEGLNHKYGVGEKISVIDKQSERELASLIFTDVIVLIDEPFTIEEITGHKDDGEPIYKTVEIYKVVQVNYKFDGIDSSVGIESSNLRTDNSDTVSSVYYFDKVQKVDAGEEYFVIGLTKNVSVVSGKYYYRPSNIDPTAYFELKIPG